MAFKLDSYARGFYGDKEYTIREGILSGKGQLELQRNISTNWEPQYWYREGILVMPLDGRGVKRFIESNNIKLGNN